MSDLEKRVHRLELLVGELAQALLRQNTETDGAWGYPSTADVLRRVQSELADAHLRGER
jgi:hypothetical protein